MDAIRQQLLRIQQQLASLSASQKMLTGSLVVIMIMTMFYWSRYAATAEMEVLIDQSLSAEEISQIKTALAAKGVKYTVTGDRILVPADKRFEAIADLGFMQLLPRDSKGSFDDIFDKISPLDNSEKSAQIYNRARTQRLEWVISRWPGVANAVVMLDATRKLSPVRPVAPVASVDVTLKSGAEVSKQLGEAVINLVAGAQAGLDRKDIRVNINGSPYRVADPSNPFAGGDSSIFEQKIKWENYYKEKIFEQFPYIPNVYATVSVTLEKSTQTSQERIVDSKNTVQLAVSESAETSENAAATPGGEPGSMSNQGVSIEQASSSAPGNTSTRDKSETRNAVDWGTKHVTTQTPAGDAAAVAASLRVPESYFRQVWKQKNPGGQTEPTEAELETFVEREAIRLREDVKKATNITDDTAVSVAMYVDVSQPTLGGDAAAASGLATMPLGIGFGAKEIAIGALAIISLFMVSMMVRRSVPQATMPQLAMAGGAGDFTDEPSIPGDVTAPADLAGEVGTVGMLLTGHEMSPDQIEAQQVIEQVGTMVKDNPDAAANLIKRWLNRD